MSERIIGVDVASGSTAINEQGVNSSGRALVESTSSSKMKSISGASGEAFIIASDFIALTSTGSFNGLVYIKNNTGKDLHIENIRTCSTASGTMQIRLIKNPTTGTLISDANAADQLSSNYGESTTFASFGLAYSASGNGKTVTDGSQSSQFINSSPGHSNQGYEGGLILTNGSSFAVTCKPSVSTTICLEIQCYFD